MKLPKKEVCQNAQTELDDIFAEADTLNDQTLGVTSDEEALAMAQAEVKTHRQSLKSQKS